MDAIWMHELELEVRDYELDCQGIVNNAVYQNYLEHGRHKFIATLGVNFAELHERGVDPVVVRAEVDYKQSLRSLDVFVIRSRVEAQGRLRFVFVQEIFRPRDQAMIVQARITAATLRNGRPGPCTEIFEALERFIASQAAPA
jgi:acyl-CoA thioester hydrolase